jgi:hypothetical protein
MKEHELTKETTETNVIWNDVKDGFSKFFKNFRSIVVIVIAMVVGWYAHQIVDVINTNTVKHTVKKLEQVTVAVNNRGELVITDYGTDRNTTYENAVFMDICKIQYRQIQTDFKAKK